MLRGRLIAEFPTAAAIRAIGRDELHRLRRGGPSGFLDRLVGAGVPVGTAELLITREWAILAGENDYTTGTFRQITGRLARPVAEFLHEHCAEFR